LLLLLLTVAMWGYDAGLVIAHCPSFLIHCLPFIGIFISNGSGSGILEMGLLLLNRLGTVFVKKFEQLGSLPIPKFLESDRLGRDLIHRSSSVTNRQLGRDVALAVAVPKNVPSLPIPKFLESDRLGRDLIHHSSSVTNRQLGRDVALAVAVPKNVPKT
jgi:hypothetical protein